MRQEAGTFGHLGRAVNKQELERGHLPLKVSEESPAITRVMDRVEGD